MQPETTAPSVFFAVIEALAPVTVRCGSVIPELADRQAVVAVMQNADWQMKPLQDVTVTLLPVIGPASVMLPPTPVSLSVTQAPVPAVTVLATFRVLAAFWVMQMLPLVVHAPHTC